jgi:nucleotide-binding universal stress UspA family protein
MYKHLLVPIDGSALSERAEISSIGLARQLGARITGFVVEPLAPLPNEGTAVATYTRDSEQHRALTDAHAHEALATFAARAAEAGVPFEGHTKRTESVDEAIVEAAAEYGCDLVVMATHGRGALGEMLFGSHTKSVISRSKLPLLVLH